jgi:hypothetical protein
MKAGMMVLRLLGSSRISEAKQSLGWHQHPYNKGRLPVACGGFG